MSHVVSLKVKVTNMSLFVKVLEEQGIKYENKEVVFYAGRARGLAFTLSGWRYPVVVRDDGTVEYDNYNGLWGDQKQLDALMEKYVVRRAEEFALANGWGVNHVKGGLEIIHPSGGIISIHADGTVATQGFVGGECEIATSELEGALGDVCGRIHTSEYLRGQQEVHEGEG